MCRREGNECKTCVGNNCNLKARFQSCFACNSDTDLNCVSLKDPLPNRICRSYADECKTVTLLGGRTERGCANELIVTGEALSYECAELNCNANLFPTNRLSCHQCSGPECSADLTSNTTFLETCRNYDINDQCFSFVDSEY